MSDGAQKAATLAEQAASRARADAETERLAHDLWVSARSLESGMDALRQRLLIRSHDTPHAAIAFAITQSLLGVLRTMEGGTLEIHDTADHGFNVDVTGVYYHSTECAKHLADLAVAINYAPPK